jgi:cytochrome c biogenesis protein CcmG, thiol:disulfide interchange protein DsbE
MRADPKFVVPAVLIALLALATTIRYENLDCGPSTTGEPAPDFAAVVRAGEGRGDRVSLDALRGRVVVLDFWAHWCVPCRESTPILNDIRAELSDEPVSFYGVNVEENLPPRRIIEEHARLGAAFPTFHDQDKSMTTDYRASRLPTLVVIDREGVIRFSDSGVPDRVGFEALIRDLL